MSHTTGVGTPPLAERILQAARSGELSMPPLPDLATKVMDLLRDEDEVDPHQFTGLIQNDAALTAPILRMANSTAFAGLRAVSDLDHAIARLGVRQVAYVVTAVVHRGNFSSDDPDRRNVLRQLWDHAVHTALAAKLLAATGGGDHGEAFLAGLLHDTGKLLVLKGIDEAKMRTGATVSPAVVDELVTLLHTELGHGSLVSWHITDSACHVALNHHDPDPPADDYLLLRVQLGNAIARKTGAHPHPDPDLDLRTIPAFELLDLDEVELAELMMTLSDEIAEVHQLF